MSDQDDEGLEEVFEKVENALKNQLNHLRSLGEAVNAIEREEINGGTIGHRQPPPNSAASKLSRREKLWKEGRRNLLRFIDEFEEQISARSFLHLRKSQAQRQRTQSPELRIFPQEEIKGIVADPPNFESPRQVPKPVEIYGKSGCFSPAPLARARVMSPPTQANSKPPTPPVPERHPSRRTSEIRSPTGSVMLLNPPVGFITNMLPEEHVLMAKEKQRESMIRVFDPDFSVRRGSSRTPDSIPISPASSYNATPTESPHRSRSTNSLKVEGVAEEHAAPSNLIPLILASSLRPTSRTPRATPSVPYHAPTLSASLASKNFYNPQQEANPHPTSHLPTAIRSSSSLFASNHPEPAALPPHKIKPSEVDTKELQTTQIQFVREKLTRDRKKAELQWTEANRMLKGLPAIGDQGMLPEGWPTLKPRERPKPRRVMSEGGHGLDDTTIGEESMRKRIKNLWKVGTGRRRGC